MWDWNLYTNNEINIDEDCLKSDQCEIEIHLNILSLIDYFSLKSDQCEIEISKTYPLNQMISQFKIRSMWDWNRTAPQFFAGLYLV